MGRPRSDVLDHDALDLVRRVVEAVHGLLELVEDLADGDEAQGVVRPATAEQFGHPGVVRWAREEAPCLTGARPRDLARRLCDRLMERLDPLPGRETVAG